MDIGIDVEHRSGNGGMNPTWPVVLSFQYPMVRTDSTYTTQYDSVKYGLWLNPNGNGWPFTHVD